MLSPDYLKSCADDIIAYYQALEDEIINDIVRRLVNTDFQITQSAVWQAEKLQQAGMIYDDVIKRVAKASGKAESLIRDLFEEGGTETLSFDDAIYRKAGLNPLPIAQSKAMLNVLTAGAKKTGGTIKNLTMTTATTSQTAFINACDFGYLKITSGAFDYNTAIRQAVKSIADAGTSVLYPSGHTDKIDVAVRRAVTTGVSQTCGQLQWDRADEMDCDLVETTAHMGARLEHTYWQGQIFSRSGNGRYPDFVESTGYGTGAGLMGWNCRHGFYPYFEGISKRAYSQAELDRYKNHTVTYNGQVYSDYEASQIQRGIERNIRATKRELNAFDTAIKEGNASFRQDYTDSAVKLKRQEHKLNDFLKQTGREEDKARVLVNGFGRSEARKAAETSKKVLQNLSESSILKSSDIQIGKSLGAAAFRDTVFLPNGNKGKIAEGTKITKVVVFAGKGTKKPVKIAEYLSDKYKDYNVPTTEWKKVRGDGYVVCDDGVTRHSELHWFESQQTGRIRMKVKRYFDDES